MEVETINKAWGVTGIVYESKVDFMMSFWMRFRIIMYNDFSKKKGHRFLSQLGKSRSDCEKKKAALVKGWNFKKT